MSLPSPDTQTITNENELSPDDGLYSALDEADVKALTEQTGIKDPEELKKHVANIRAEAYKVSRTPLSGSQSFSSSDHEPLHTDPPIPLHSSVFVRKVCILL